MIETELYTALTADATVNAAVAGRVYPLVMPQNPTLPAITYERISGQKVNGLAGYLGMDNAHIMLNVWATRYDTAKELAEDVHDCMNKTTAFKALLINDLDGYDPDIGLYVVSQDYSCWNACAISDYGPELMQNGGFETLTSGADDDGVADNFANWFKNSFLTVIVESVTTTKHSGTRACKCTNGGLVSQSFNVTAGATYRLIFWTRGDGTNAGTWEIRYFSQLGLIDGGSTGITGTTWTRVEKDITLPGDAGVIDVNLKADSGAGKAAYFDDVSFMKHV